MKRDWDLIRNILLEIEAYEGNNYVPLQIEGYSDDLVSYHVKLLSEAGLIDTHDCGRSLGVISLTWDGHEFLDASRNETIWSKAKSTITNKGGELSFDILKLALFEATKKMIL